jgi:hypothetical protein
MTMSDFYLNAAQQRAAELEMELSAARTDLLTHRHNQDLQSAGEAVQRIANLTAEQSNLRGLVDGYVQSQQPPRQPELTPEERDAKPWSKMDYNDVLEMCRGSKYAKDLTWNADMQAGYEETRRRKSRGE